MEKKLSCTCSLFTFWNKFNADNLILDSHQFSKTIYSNLLVQRDWVNKERWWIQDKKVWGWIPQCWSCVSMSANFSIPYCLRPPSHNVYLVHRSKIGLTAAGCHRHPLTGRVNCWLSYIYAQTFKWIPSPFPSQGTCRFYYLFTVIILQLIC